MNIIYRIAKYITVISLIIFTAQSNAGSGSSWGAFAGGLFAGSVIANASAPRERTVIVERPPAIVERVVVERPQCAGRNEINSSYHKRSALEQQQTADIQEAKNKKIKKEAIEADLALQREKNRELELKTKYLEMENKKLELENEKLKLQTPVIKKPGATPLTPKKTQSAQEITATSKKGNSPIEPLNIEKEVS